MWMVNLNLRALRGATCCAFIMVYLAIILWSSQNIPLGVQLVINPNVWEANSCGKLVHILGHSFKGSLQVKYKFASKVYQICIDYDKIKSFLKFCLFFSLEQNRTLFWLILRTSSSHSNGPHPYTPGTSSLSEEVPGVYGCGPLECEDEVLRISQ